MSAQAADIHLLRRLSQLEKDLDGMCKELHRRRSPPKSSNQEPRARASAGHSKETRRKSNPQIMRSASRGERRNPSKSPSASSLHHCEPQLMHSASRGERQNPSKSPSASSLHHCDQKLSAVFTKTHCERRAGASREDCGSNQGSNAWTGSVPSTRPAGTPRNLDRSNKISSTPRDLLQSLSKSQSTTAAGLGSPSSQSCATLVPSNASLGPPRMRSNERSIISTTPRLRRQTELPHGTGMGKSPATRSDTFSKSMGASTADLGDSDGSHADAKRDLVWQLELEKLRNATLKLEVQKEISESSDLKKRLLDTESLTVTPTQTLLAPAVSSIGAPLVPTASVSRLSVSQVSSLQQSLINGNPLHYSPRHRIL